MKLLKQAGLPDRLTAELHDAYDMCDYGTMSESELAAVAPIIDVMVTNGEAVVTAELISQFPALKLIVVFGVGYDGVDVSAAASRGIAVTHTPEVLTDDVADLAIGLMIATCRKIVAAQKFIERGGWQQGGFQWTKKVSGARLGIVGMGRIGQAIARRATGFSMAISYYDRRSRELAGWDFQSDIYELARQSDILVVCIPGGEDTRGLIDAQVLRALGPEGVLINVGRGSVVDENALTEAIQQEYIAGAGLDVFSDEPEVPESLLQRDDVVVTPHMASATWQTRAEMSRLVMENIRAWQQGWPLVTPVR